MFGKQSAWSLAKHVDNSQIYRPSPDFILMMNDVSERGHCHTFIIQLLHMAKKTKLRAKIEVALSEIEAIYPFTFPSAVLVFLINW